MSLVQQIKRAAINHGMYKGNVDDNWEPADRLMYHRLCNRFHGHYTDYPSRSNQNKDFLEWLDKYKDPEYSEERSTVSVVNPGGIDLKQLIPDKLPVNTEGAASKQEIKARDAMVNENHFALPKPPKKITPNPEDVVKQEAENEQVNSGLPNKDSVQSNPETGNETGNNESGSNDSNKSSDGQNSSKELANSEQISDAGGGEQKETTNPARNTSPPGETSKPARIIPSNKPAPFVNVDKNTIKTR